MLMMLYVFVWQVLVLLVLLVMWLVLMWSSATRRGLVMERIGGLVRFSCRTGLYLICGKRWRHRSALMCIIGRVTVVVVEGWR
jgi:hypothetical protein